MTTPGRATPEATRARLGRFPAHEPHGHATLGGTGLAVSRLGFGCYRVDDETPGHRQALEAALAAGCNLIDTSTNYTDGASERLIGDVLERAHAGAGLRRDAVTVVSKIGYVQGDNLRLALERERAGFAFPEMVKYMDGCWHCIHPDFLRDQLARSRERLRLETVDVCLLHNPEYFLSDAKKHGPGRPLDELRVEFYRRVRDAFALFEDAARRHEVGCYGVSSNTLVSAADDPEATSVTWLLKAAEEAGGKDHHFRVLQLPMNLFESGGALLLNTGPDRSQTALEAAAAAGLAVLINRPLNAIVHNRLIRLADVEDGSPGESVSGRMKELKALEQDYRTQIAPLAGTAQEAIDPFFELIEQLGALPDQLDDRESWKQIEQQYVIPRINHTARVMGRDVPAGLRSAWTRWWERCLPALEGLLHGIAREAGHRSRSRGRAVTEAIDPLLPAGRRAESLSRKALWVLTGTPGVTSVLVGMRQPSYVRDAMEVLAWAPLTEALGVYRRVKKVKPK